MRGSAHPFSKRNSQHGIVLLTTLISVLLLAALTAMVQAQEQANVKSMASLAKSIRDGVAKDSVHERLRGLIAIAMSSELWTSGVPRFDSTPLVLAEGGHDWEVRVQDVEGLVDIYLAPPEVLAFLPIDVTAFVAERERVRQELGPSERFPTLESTLTRLGQANKTTSDLVTQSSQTGALRVRVLSVAFRDHAKEITRGVRENEPTVAVMVWVR